MTQSNKILTVSYGTFSCTLEGFDDAFGTMKAIAEYFRDLAAEDRYFGAEPPQPDAEMLAHIAQKEVARRVEAHQDQSGIVLRAQEITAATAAVAEVAEEEPQPTEDAVVEEVADAPEVEVEDVSDAIAAELAADAEEADEDIAVEEEAAKDSAEDIAFEEDEPAEAVMPADLDAGTEETAAAFFASTTDEEAPEEEFEAEPVVAADESDAEDSIAAKLRRIRAVVSKVSPADPISSFDEDEDAEFFDAADTEDEGAAVLQDALETFEQIDAALDEEDELLDDLNARLNALDAAADVEVDVEEDGDDELIEDEAELVEDEADADFEEEDVESDFEDMDAEAAFEGADEAEAEAAFEDADVEATVETRAQARLVKVTKEEFDAIIASDREEEAETYDLDEDVVEDPMPQSSLSQEDEDDLMRELAEVEADADEAEMEDDDVASIFAEAGLEDEDDVVSDRAILSEDADSDADVSRLLDEAGDKLEDAETNDRRSEFAHLRAAMAAGKAEEAAGGSMSETASDDEYREDLARVVKPRRPGSGEPNDRGRRGHEKPAPLKLVAAQRIDAEPAPVQPRRVMSKQVEDTSFDTADGKMKFSDYAAGVGANELPDLLEAAAAYLSFVEGQEHFSRPQLMTKVRMVDHPEFSREDGLRSFGLLLRDGKIEKTQAGRFTVSDRIGFRPEDMRAAG